MLSEKKGSLGNWDGVDSTPNRNLVWARSHCDAVLRPPLGWDLEASFSRVEMGFWVLPHSALATSLDCVTSLPNIFPEQAYFWVTKKLLPKMSKVLPFPLLLFLGNPRRSDHPGQSPPGGFWKCQDCEEWQLLEICKTHSNCQQPPETKPSPPVLDVKKWPHKLGYSWPHPQGLPRWH